METKFVNIEEFIVEHKKHNHNYCEIIVEPDGSIVYAHPSHLMKLEQLWGVPDKELFETGPIRTKLYSEMSMSVSPLHWLSETLQCVVCWFNGIVVPLNYTEAELVTVHKLIKSNCISQYCWVEISTDKTKEGLWDNIAELRNIYEKSILLEQKLKERLEIISEV